MDGNGAILYPQAAATAFDLDERAPGPQLAAFVQGYWITRWDRRGLAPFTAAGVTQPLGQPHTETWYASRVAGVSLGMFTEVLEDRHVVFGVRFRPGGFRPFLGSSVSTISGRFLPIGDVFGPPGVALERPVVEAPSTAEMVTLVEAFLSARIPPPDPDRRAGRRDGGRRRGRLDAHPACRVAGTLVGTVGVRTVRKTAALRRVRRGGPRVGHPPLSHAGSRGAGRRRPGRLGSLGRRPRLQRPGPLQPRDFTANIGVTPSHYTRLCADRRSPRQRQAPSAWHKGVLWFVSRGVV